MLDYTISFLYDGLWWKWLFTLKNVTKNDSKLIVGGGGRIKMSWMEKNRQINNRWGQEAGTIIRDSRVPIPYILLNLQNEYTRNVSISYYFLIWYVLSSKNCLNCFTSFGPSVRQSSLSWVRTIWQLCATALYNKVGSQIPTRHLLSSPE